jgi:hypothetical protein
MTMTNGHLHTEKAGPLWAVFGAPLVGVPLMVALLALCSGTTVEAAGDVEAGFSVEQVEQVEMPQELEAQALRHD